jgi:hypothetical protein
LAKPKTPTNDASVDKFLAGIKDDQKRTDFLTILELMKELTGEPAVMLGKAKVGFGSFHYRGKTSEGDWFHVCFSDQLPKAGELRLPAQELASHFGKERMEE